MTAVIITNPQGIYYGVYSDGGDYTQSDLSNPPTHFAVLDEEPATPGIYNANVYEQGEEVEAVNYIKIKPSHLDFIKVINTDALPKDVLVEIVGKQRGVLINPKLVIDPFRIETLEDSSGFTLQDHEGNTMAGVYSKPTIEPGELDMLDHDGDYLLDHEGLELAGFGFIDTGEHFKVMGVEGGILQAPVASEAGEPYYLHPDGTINTNPEGALMQILRGRADGRFDMSVMAVDALEIEDAEEVILSPMFEKDEDYFHE